MAQTWIQKAFRPIKATTPAWFSNPIRSVATAFLTPVLFSVRTGHGRSSFARKAVSRRGEPVPWYTYPCIDFLTYRNYEGKQVLEFGAGQSTLWWAKRAARVVALEEDPAWFEGLRAKVPSNVDLRRVSCASPQACVESVNAALAEFPSTRFDVVVIDGLCRYEMIEIAARVVKDDGIIVCDNAERYGFYEGFRDRRFRRVDFFGHVPGVVLPQCTSIFFHGDSFAFDPGHPIPDIATDG